MTDKTTVKVGDVVAWDEVPDNSIAKEMCITPRVYWCHIDSEVRPLRSNKPWGPWRGCAPQLTMMVVATNLTGNETSDELRMLAEAFEREHPVT